MTARGWRPGPQAAPGVLAGITILTVSILIVAFAGVSPSYDPYGWLTWGWQVVHGSLSLAGAPSWKPLPFLFTAPYALAGTFAVKLWEVTAVAIALAGPFIAARVAFRLVAQSGIGPGGQAPVYACRAAGVGAGLSVLLMVGYANYWTTAQSDAMVVTLFLLAIDCHLEHRYRAALLCLWLGSLARPECWVALALYGLWALWSQPRMRGWVVVAAVLIPAFWFGVPLLCGDPADVSGQLALNSPNELHGNYVLGTISRFRSITYLAPQVAAAIGVVFAFHHRNRRVLAVAGVCVAWVVVEVGFAIHGWSAVPRYMFPAAAAMIIVGGAGAGWLLAEGAARGGVVRWIGVLCLVLLAVDLARGGVDQIKVERADLTAQHIRTNAIVQLQALIDHVGGQSFVNSCGTPSTDVKFASTLAYMTHHNVRGVGYLPERYAYVFKFPVVMFTPVLNSQGGSGWEIQLFHTAQAQSTRCSRLQGAHWLSSSAFSVGGFRYAPITPIGPWERKIGPQPNLKR